MRIKIPSAVLVFVATVATQAAGQPRFGFITLDRMDRVSRLGGQIGVPILYGSGIDDVNFLRMEMYGQGAWQFSANAAGFYGQLPLSHAFVNNGDDVTALANAELGGYFVLGTGDSDVVFRGGLSLPTADDDLDGFATNLFASFDRLTDLAGITPDTLWLRVSVSPIIQATERLTLRFDAGLDAPVDAGDRATNDVLGRFNAGMGVAVSDSVGLSLELVNIGNLTSDGDLSDRFLHTVALGVRGLGTVQPHFAVVLPLDKDINDELFALTAGVQGTFD